jgi:hypothetical protein
MSSGPIQIHFDEDLAQNRNTNVVPETRAALQWQKQRKLEEIQ